MVKIRVAIDDFDRPNGVFPIWSIFYLQYNDFYFPCYDWYDATTSILVIWMGNISRLIIGVTKEATLDFIDGDYRVTLSTKNPGSISASFFFGETRLSQIDNVDLLYFARQLLAATGRLTREFSDHLSVASISEVIVEASLLYQAIKQKEQLSNRQ